MVSSEPRIHSLAGSVADRIGASRFRLALSRRAQHGRPTLTLDGGDGEPLTLSLPPPLTNLLLQLLRHSSLGHSVALVRVGQLLSIQRAADLLGVPRTRVDAMIRTGVMPCRSVGDQRRILADDLVEHLRQREWQASAERKAAMGEYAESRTPDP